MASPISFDEQASSASSSDLFQVPLQKGDKAGQTAQRDIHIRLSDGNFEHDILACEEDESSLELQEPAQGERTGPVLTAPVGQGQAVIAFDAADARDTIRSELSKLQELRYAPVSPQAQRFAEDSRPRTVSWLIQVVSAIGLTRETLHTAISLMDRFVAGTEAHPPETVLQLLALGCLSVASKHEEVAQHSSDWWVGLAVDGEGRALYERLDLHRMEWLLLETVEWRIRVPNMLTFLRQYLAALVCHGVLPHYPPFVATFKSCAEFLVEVSLFYGELLPFSYSTIAVACLMLANQYCQSVFAAGAHTSAAAPAPAKCLVSELAAVLELDPSAIAPGLGRCMGYMGPLYDLVVRGPFGAAPADHELGLLAPVVARYRHIASQVAP
ncbi:hypothetical protein PLESTB_001106900 [Pleodorina starrii]|uniref:Cyclin-like domain-containing protein n=1 Tax=Pleodorina starrii TaxID=330485 RepID=A0A9W6F4Q9_9CHLO|nr:hypothetical protein PLESTM_001342000 [Pleodorina starrii]GLC56458.1 hypothetical protein PLESTB_001106900 [Pleodorina starrii]GLC68958.1 hypothetical protein PLESTF_000763100 [Pleodorina starrii]